VLEIGCGAGLLLARLVPECEHYVATDISTEVIARLSAQLPLLGADARKVELLSSADAAVALGSRRFDTIIVNSVCQYFPDEAYLRAQLAELVGRLEPGGVLFVGDVRHLGWNARFHADVERFQSAQVGDTADFAARVQARLRDDRELAVAPELFLDAARSLGVERVQLLPKLGRHQNEMNVYRYDAVLHRPGGAGGARAARAAEVSWTTLGSLAAVESLLRDTGFAGAGALIIRDLPNPRLGAAGVDPVEWQGFAQREDVEVELALGTGAAHFHYHVLLRKKSAATALTRQLYPSPVGAGPFCNRPLLRRARRALETALRLHLRERLPPYLQPAVFVFLDRLPVTSNGKVDREALPAPQAGVAGSNQALTPTQERLRVVWARLLGLEDIGPHDSFHALGGDSLSAVRMLDAIKVEFGVELRHEAQPLTLASLAERIELAMAQRALNSLTAGAAGAREVLRL
jgi:SAM-dependent methyltransferase/acyl carrier protein